MTHPRGQYVFSALLILPMACGPAEVPLHFTEPFVNQVGDRDCVADLFVVPLSDKADVRATHELTQVQGNARAGVLKRGDAVKITGYWLVPHHGIGQKHTVNGYAEIADPRDPKEKLTVRFRYGLLFPGPPERKQ